MGAPRALACPPTCRPRLQTGSVCRQPTAEAALFWENVGELTMDREIREQIAQRAYALWQAEGQPDGRHEEHWYRAAREIAAAESTNAAMKRTTRRKRRKK